MSQWYEELFRDFAEKYDKENFTTGTLGEAGFIEKEISFNKSAKILDIGCGTGRHSLELARRGYKKITGIDLSEAQLRKAMSVAKKEQLEIEFITRDARDFNFSGVFDLAIMICEGAFPLMETDEMNYSILRNAYFSLKPGGKFIFTTLNGLYPLFHSVKDFLNSEEVQGQTKELDFDLMTFRYHSVYETEDDKGKKLTLNCNERYYVPSEITWLLKSLGFSRSDIFGCRQGAFSRDDKLTTEDFEMLVIAEK
jgi:2-polyprenyl-3-methyl-5-hydroxy-6-metoxy-1,4-benzoquinol methylase